MSENLEPTSLETLEHTPVIGLVDPQTQWLVDTTGSLTVSVTCPEGCNLTGGTILVGDAADNVVAETQLTSFNVETRLNSTEPIDVAIPRQSGSYTWSIIYFPAEVETAATSGSTDNLTGSGRQPQIDHAIVQATYSFAALPHQPGMAVWRDEQSPVEFGTEFVLHVGCTCEQVCDLVGAEFQVLSGSQVVASGKLEAPTADKPGLYQTMIRLLAPTELNVYDWSVRLAITDLPLEHLPNERKFSFATTPPAQTTLRVKVVDATDQTPQKQADVIVKAVDGYPHIQRTDDQGYAEFPVPFGTFDVHGHQMDYDSGSATVEVQTEAGADVTLGLRYHPQIWG